MGFNENLLGVTSYYAELEAIRISDRTKAGLERARSGKDHRKTGQLRAVATGARRDARRRLWEKKMSRETGLSYNTVKKYLARTDASGATKGTAA